MEKQAAILYHLTPEQEVDTSIYMAVLEPSIKSLLFASQRTNRVERCEYMACMGRFYGRFSMMRRHELYKFMAPVSAYRVNSTTHDRVLVWANARPTLPGHEADAEFAQETIDRKLKVIEQTQTAIETLRRILEQPEEEREALHAQVIENRLTRRSESSSSGNTKRKKKSSRE